MGILISSRLQKTKAPAVDNCDSMGKFYSHYEPWISAIDTAILLISGCASQSPGEGCGWDEQKEEKEQEANLEIEEPAKSSEMETQKSIEKIKDRTKEEKPAIHSSGFFSLTELDAPLECNIKYTYQERRIPAKVFMKGISGLRVESSSDMAQCARTITIIRGNPVCEL